MMPDLDKSCQTVSHLVYARSFEYDLGKNLRNKDFKLY